MAVSHTCDKCHTDIDNDRQDYADCRLIIEITKANVPLGADSTRRLDFCDHECLMGFIEDIRDEDVY
jgi:hypothetical protein